MPRQLIDETHIRELLRTRQGRLYHREGQELEFKEQFNLAGLADYFRDFAAFANNRGGYLIFGVKDKPRELGGLSHSSRAQFEKIDPERISGYLLDIFSSEISWEQASIESRGKTYGVFRVRESTCKPVIARRDEGKDQVIKNGEIYYRYGGRTQRIQSAELESIISQRIEHNNRHWLDLMEKIGKAGPQNAAILDTENGLIEKGESQILVVDEGLASKLSFVREGQFAERVGAPTLKLVGDVVPVESVEVVRHVKEHLTKEYPYSATELAAAVCARCSKASQHDVWRAIADNDLKSNTRYSAYNFRNKSQEDRFRETGHIPAATPSIYNQHAVDFLIKVIGDGKT